MICVYEALEMAIVDGARACLWDDPSAGSKLAKNRTRAVADKVSTALAELVRIAEANDDVDLPRGKACLRWGASIGRRSGDVAVDPARRQPLPDTDEPVELADEPNQPDHVFLAQRLAAPSQA